MPAPKAKTKAKQRYLKAKKERRKARKAAGPKPFGEGKKKRAAERAPGQDDDHAEPKRVRPTEIVAKESASSDTESDATHFDKEESLAVVPNEEEIPTTIQADPLQPGTEASMEEEAMTEEPASSKYLYRFPRPQQTTAIDTQLLTSQGIPAALSKPTDVSMSHTQTLDTQDIGGVRLSTSVRRQLERLGIEEWFAVQASVIPWLMNHTASHRLYLPYAPPRDLCVSAPTGSGKTLAYTVPIVELLQTRVIVQLRALILVPTRDLAVQVRDMFDAVGKGSGLRTAAITGSHKFRQEQAQLVRQVGDDTQSLVDVVIATPGRLVDHVRGTPGFTLEHLRFLVIDEADRLLGQSFQQWVPTLLDAMESHTHAGTAAPQSLAAEMAEAPWTQDDLAAPQSSVQKLLFSATLTRDPAKMGALHLRDPHYIRVRDLGEGTEQESFALPAKLQQHMVVTPSHSKVLHLLHLLHTTYAQPVRHALCFTKSVEAANRLVRLLTFFEEAWAQQAGAPPLQIQFYSSDLGTGERATMLRRFQDGEIDVLVCSDLIARGIDLPDVQHVVSYDIPIDMAKYVHRVGRTARAGRTGDAWSLVEEQEVYHFKRMLREAGQWDRVHTEKIKADVFEPYMSCYKDALARLARIYSQQR